MAWEGIPEELKGRRQWVCWRYEPSESGKATKVPYTIGGYKASSTSPRDWYSFEEVVEASGKFDGIGFVFTEDDPYCGIDLDDCLDGGEVKPWAEQIVAHLDATYSETSPSGNGIKYICLGINPLERGGKTQVGDGAVEIYDRARFFTITGQIRGSDKPVRRQPELDWLVAEHFQARENLAGVFDSPVEIQDCDKVAAASAYLREVDPAISGSSGHDTTFRAACCLVLGFDLSVDEAFGLLWNEYNPRCQPPWSEKEIRHKVESANKQPGNRGYLLPRKDHAAVDLSALIGQERTDDFDDESFCREKVPQSGLLRDVFDFYGELAQRKSNIMGLAVAVSFCEVLFGRRICSHTDLRTNDYNVIIAPTNCGKEACEKTIIKIFDAVDPENKFIVPPDVQSGNGLMSALAENRCCTWVADEFGKVLAAVLDKKQRNPHQSQIATYLLKLYGKADSVYSGAAYAGGTKYRVVQPHLCVLGLTTDSTLFESVDASNVADGLFGRIAFWPVKDRPKRGKMTKADVPGELVRKAAMWAAWQPSGNLGSEFPDPAMLRMSPDALRRWTSHSDAIDDRMDEESETRNAIWGRVAARSMKLAMVHRAARIDEDPSINDWEQTQIELEDMEWAVSIANWLARIACQLIGDNFVDNTTMSIQNAIRGFLEAHSEVSVRTVSRAKRTWTTGGVVSAAKQLEKAGVLELAKESTGGRPRWMIRRRGT